jgi:hypothetical protein
MGLESALWIGVVLSGGTISGALASLNYDHVRTKVGRRGPLTFAFGLFMVGFGVVVGAASPMAVAGGAALAGGGMGLLVPSLVDGAGEAAPPGIRGRVMGGLSTLRNLGRFASPVLAGSALVGPGASAPFIGGAALAGGLALATLLWAGTCRHLRVSAPPAATADEPVPC